MTDMFPGVGMFFIVLGVFFALNFIVMMMGIPYVLLVTGALFWLWVVWSLVALMRYAIKERRNS